MPKYTGEITNKSQLKSNSLTKKYRTKKEQTSMAMSRAKLGATENAKKAFKIMLDNDKKKAADRRKAISNRSK